MWRRACQRPVSSAKAYSPRQRSPRSRALQVRGVHVEGFPLVGCLTGVNTPIPARGSHRRPTWADPAESGPAEDTQDVLAGCGRILVPCHSASASTRSRCVVSSDSSSLSGPVSRFNPLPTAAGTTGRSTSAPECWCACPARPSTHWQLTRNTDGFRRSLPSSCCRFPYRAGEGRAWRGLPVLVVDLPMAKGCPVMITEVLGWRGNRRRVPAVADTGRSVFRPHDDRRRADRGGQDRRYRRQFPDRLDRSIHGRHECMAVALLQFFADRILAGSKYF